jgi:predicted unusual protein kinase regulating ubiquinone biosynthesis (AarF/ABC1/UbiB family)
MARKSGSRLGRLAKLGSLTANVTSRYVGNALRTAFQDEEARKKSTDQLHVDNARQIVATVGRLRGAAQKLGQQLAQAASSLDLPPEVAATLSKLNSDAPPVPFAHIREDVEAELEAPLRELFRWFDPEPLGTASLGQAHVAKLHDGTEVVVKVLHRGVEEGMDADLLALRAILLSGRIVRRDKAEVEEAFDEIKARLAEELDYLQEAANIQAYHELFKDDPRVRVPRLHPSLCTERVLTMDRLPGKHVDAWIAGGATREARQRAGETLTDVYYIQLFRHRTLLADPHPGNYLFEDDGRVGLLDFGCVKRFDEFWMGTYAKTAYFTKLNDRDTVLAAALELGAWDGTNPEDGQLIWDFCDIIGRGFRKGPFTIGGGHEQMMDEMRPIGKRFVRRPTVHIPRHVLFAHRALGGLYTMLRTLEVTIDFGAVLEEHATFAIAKAEGRC